MTPDRPLPTRALVVTYLLVFLATMWPVYPMVNHIFPLVLGMPFSLFYLVCLNGVSFLVLLAVDLWLAGVDPEP